MKPDQVIRRQWARAAACGIVLTALAWAAVHGAGAGAWQRGQIKGQQAAPAVPATFEEKMAWILMLEDRRVLQSDTPMPDQQPAAPVAGSRDRRAVPPPLVPDLRPLLADREARIRRRAALAVGRAGVAEGVASLAPLLFKDAEPEVRQMAAFGMGLIGSPSAVEHLRAALADPSALVRGRAAEALAAIGDTGSASAIADMTASYVKDPRLAALQPDEQAYPLPPEIEAYRLGLYALTRLKAWDALRPLVMTADGVPLSHWWPVAFALSRMEDPRAVPALLGLARGTGGTTRAFAARGLGARKAADAVPVLVAMVEDWRLDARTAVSALRALGQIGDASASTALRRFLMAKDVDPNLRLEGLVTLGLLHDQASFPLMVDSLADPWAPMRAAALRAVHATDPDNFLTVLSGLDRDPHVSARMALASLLTSVPAEAAVPRLTLMLADKDRRGVPAVIAALAKLEAPDLGPRLLALLEDADVMVRAAAAEAIGRLRVPGAEDALAAAYRVGAGDGAYNARAAALGALRQYGAAVAMPVLREALVDPDWAVRVRAAVLMRELDPAASAEAAMRPAPGRPAADYTRPHLVNPPVSPHVYLETDRGTVMIELFVLDAPQTCENFLRLAREGFFTGVAIHRVVPNFVVQDGDPRGDGEGGPGYTIRDEINQRPFQRGTVGMALEWADTGGSQWFVTHSPQPHLDGRYTAFGLVVEGLDVVDAIRQGDVIRRVRTWDGVSMTTR